MSVVLWPVSDSPGELRFAHSHRSSLALGLAGLAAAWAAWTFVDGDASRQTITVFASLVSLHGFYRAVRRDELRLDLEKRRWRRRTGTVFTPTTTSGSLDDLKAVVLTAHEASRGSDGDRAARFFEVALEMEGEAWDQPAVVGLAADEEDGRRLLERYARRLRVDASDRTADADAGEPWEELDATSGRSPAMPEAPPRDSGVTMTVEAGRRRVTLPPVGLMTPAVVLVPFGLLFLAMGTVGLADGLEGLLGNGLAGADPLSGIVGGVMIFVGARTAFRGVMAIRGREWIVDEPDRLRFGVSGPFGASRRRSLPKGGIEVDVVVSTGARRSRGTLYVLGIRVPLGSASPERGGVVRVRSGEATVYLGKRLPPDARAWLRYTLERMARETAAR